MLQTTDSCIDSQRTVASLASFMVLKTPLGGAYVPKHLPLVGSPATLTPMGTRIGIRDVCSQAGVRARTLRDWMSKGLLPRPRGRGWSSSYTDEHILRARVIRYLRSQHNNVDQIRARMAGLGSAELQALLPSEGPPPPAPVAAPDYPSWPFDVVQLMPGLLLLVDRTRGELPRRVANEIYQHFALRDRQEMAR